ncbi:hypothetical protein CDAR_245391 [Caerostris darwini]|uniref:Uncharacterized protein n=1 Tax=Caerostris darwini TaxID=1538125 RepID=A0AAV4P1Z5_9ARAC|nr:hypothetical protein CDAR_245391 [Caerostris darwini]
MMIDCLDEMNLESMSDVMKSCYPGIADEINGAAIIKWLCEHTDEELLVADKCSEQLLKETGDDEDMNMDMMNDMMTCVEEKMG